MDIWLSTSSLPATALHPSPLLFGHHLLSLTTASSLASL
jgi:hypothetical protein